MNALPQPVQRHITAAWRHRWKAVLLTWLVCAVGWAVVLAIPNQYQANARFYVDTDAILTPVLRGIAVDTSNSSQLDILQKTLLSRPNLDKLISKTNLELQLAGPASREQMIDRLASQIQLSPQTRTLFALKYRNEDPRLAYDVVRTMLAMFIESKTDNSRSDVESARNFLDNQIGLYERQLRSAERKRADFRARYIDLLPPDGGGVNKLDQQNQALRILQGQLQDTLARRNALEKELQNTPELVVTETGPGSVARRSDQLTEAEGKLAELRLRYTESFPDVIAQRNLVQSLRAGEGRSRSGSSDSQFRPGSRSAPNPVYEQLKIKAVEDAASISSLERQVTDATAERDRLADIARGAPGLQAEYVNINRDYDVVRRNYDDLLARREAMRLTTAADAEGDKMKIQVVDPPTIPQVPVAPKRLLLLTGVLAAGLMAGLGGAFLLTQVDQSFRLDEDLVSAGLDSLGGISLIKPRRSAARQSASLAAFCLASILPPIVYGGLVLEVSKSSGLFQ